MELGACGSQLCSVWFGCRMEAKGRKLQETDFRVRGWSISNLGFRSWEAPSLEAPEHRWVIP